MNLCTWAIDKAFRRHQFGVSKEDIAAEKAAKESGKGGRVIMNKIVKLTLILFLVCAIVAGILGGINELTKGPIAEQKAIKTGKGLRRSPRIRWLRAG